MPEPVAASTAERARPPHPGRRPLWTVVLLLLLGAGGLYLASKLTWGQTTELSPVHGRVTSPVPGSQVSPGLLPLALVALAAIAAALAIGGWPRRVLGGLVVIAGLADVYLGVSGIGAVFGAHPSGYPTSQAFFGHLLPIVAGVLVVAGGIVMVRAADVLPRLGASYETPGAAKRAKDPDAELWQALSQGDDPTDRD